MDVTGADTTRLDNNKVRVSRTLTITAFDEKLYSIPGMQLKVNGKTIKGTTILHSQIMAGGTLDVYMSEK